MRRAMLASVVAAARGQVAEADACNDIMKLVASTACDATIWGNTEKQVFEADGAHDCLEHCRQVDAHGGCCHFFDKDDKEANVKAKTCFFLPNTNTKPSLNKARYAASWNHACQAFPTYRGNACEETHALSSFGSCRGNEGHITKRFDVDNPDECLVSCKATQMAGCCDFNDKLASCTFRAGQPSRNSSNPNRYAVAFSQQCRDAGAVGAVSSAETTRQADKKAEVAAGDGNFFTRHREQLRSAYALKSDAEAASKDENKTASETTVSNETSIADEAAANETADASSTVEVFDPETQSWKKIRVPATSKDTPGATVAARVSRNRKLDRSSQLRRARADERLICSAVLGMVPMSECSGGESKRTSDIDATDVNTCLQKCQNLGKEGCCYFNEKVSDCGFFAGQPAEIANGPHRYAVHWSTPCKKVNATNLPARPQKAAVKHQSGKGKHTSKLTTIVKKLETTKLASVNAAVKAEKEVMKRTVAVSAWIKAEKAAEAQSNSTAWLERSKKMKEQALKKLAQAEKKAKFKEAQVDRQLHAKRTERMVQQRKQAQRKQAQRKHHERALTPIEWK